MFIFDLELNKDRIPKIIKKRRTPKYDPRDRFICADDVVNLVNDIYRLKQKAEEYLLLAIFDAKGHAIALSEISHGTVNASLCQPREILIRALLAGAASIILIHNHPSGVPDPSSSDYEVAKQLKHACDIISINLLDFIIIGDDKYYSMKESNDL